MSESSRPSSTPKQEAVNSKRRGTIRTAGGLSQRFVDTLGWVITGMWAASMTLQVIIDGYEPPMTIHILMTAVAGAAFGTNFIKPRNGGGNDA